MSGATLYRRIIAPKAPLWAVPLRGMLAVAAQGYRAAVALRNRRYDRRGPRVRLPVPVISIGNLTVGGTGKTPLVIDLVQGLEAAGRSPAVVARGYRATPDQPNDEELLIRKRCPAAVYVADPDRAEAAALAHRRFGADVIVLDDGFQHRRLARDLDIVLIDATCPFGYGHLLPRGLLREPITALRRAGAVVLTRCDQASPADLSRIEARVRHFNPDAPTFKCVHRVTAVRRLNGEPVTDCLEGRRAVLFAGIANPPAFVATASTLGVRVVGQKWWPDHYGYRRSDVDALLSTGRFPEHDWLITTEKDAVKLSTLGGLDHAPIAVLEISIEFLEDGASRLHQLMRTVFSGHRGPNVPQYPQP